MIERYATLLLRHPVLCLLASLLLVALAAAGASRLALSNDLETFFDPSDPQLKAYDAVREVYTSDDNIFFVLVPDNGDVFTQANLAIVERLTEAAWRMPHTLRVDSITNFQHTEAVEDDLYVAPLVEDAADMSDAQVARAERIATTEPLLAGRLITPSGHMTAINATIVMGDTPRDVAIGEVITYARALRDEIEAEHPVRVLLTGKVAGDHAFSEAAIRDLTTIIPLALLFALLCITAYMALASRDVATTLATSGATILVIVASVATGMGAAGWVGYDITPALANAPTVILTLAVADCVHIIVTYFQALQRGLARDAALAESLRLNAQAVALTSITTIIGFLALNFSESPPFRDLGNVVSMGIAAAWLLSMTLLPALLALLPARVPVAAAGQRPGMERLANWVIAHRRGSFAVCALLVLGFAACVPQNKLYDVWAEYFDTSMQIRKDSDEARAHLNGFNTIEFSVGAGQAERESGAVAEPAYLQTLNAFSDWLRAQPEIAHVNTFSDIMKRLNQNMHGDDPDWYRLPEQRDLAAQYMLLYEFSLPQGLDLTNQVNQDKSATRVIASIRTSSTDDVLNVQARAQDWMRENAPPAFFHAGASSDVMFAHIGKRNIISMLYGAGLGLLLIAVIIGFALRSFTFGALSLVTNVLPLIVGFGVWGVLVGRVGLGLSAVSGLTMGIVVDYTVHLFSKYLRARREQNLATPDAIRYAFGTVGVALVVTTVVLCVNFGMLAFSIFALNSDMGTLTAGIILIALVIDLFLLPPLLMWVGGQSAPARSG